MPRRLFFLLKRVILVTNNTLALTLSFQLLFTPMFGDYTFVGRLMGFVYRIAKIVLGTALVMTMLFSSIFVLVFWYLSPAVLFYYLGPFSLIIFGILFVVFLIRRLRSPQLRVQQVKSSADILKTLNFKSGLLPEPFSTETFVQELFAKEETQHVLESLELKSSDLPALLLEHLRTTTLSKEALLSSALEYAKEEKTRYLEVEHLFLALLNAVPQKEAVLAKFALTFQTVKDAAFWIVDEREALAKIFFWQPDYEVPPIGGVNRGRTSRVTPLLDSISQDYTKLAEQGYIEKVVGKEKAMKEVIEALGKGTNNNVLIVGEPGSGKTTLVKGLAQEIIHGTKAQALKFKRLVSLESSALIAGCSTPGEVNAKLEAVIKEIKDAGNIIVFVDEIHTLVASTGGENAQLSGVFNALEPRLSEGDFQFIGATSMPDYRKYIEPNGSFSRIFQTIYLDEATPEETLAILKVLEKKFRKLYKVKVSYLALKRTIELSAKLIHERVLPDKAVSILDKACSLASGGDKYVTTEEIRQIISEITKVPVTSISADESKKLLTIEQEMGTRVIGQLDAIKQIGDAIRRARAGMRDEKRPIASFLFVGSTGVGKTETAKALAATYFGDEKVMIRLDMSEYQKDDAVDKLIGTSDGKTSGILTEKVRTSPFSLILLDEIEKASPKILLLFLQVLDDGRLSDNTGRVIDFTNTIIIATSNVGTSTIQAVAAAGGTYAQMKEKVMIEVRDHYAPEFLNRFSGVITFEPLTREDVEKIAQLLLSKVVKMTESKGIKLSFKPELVAKLAEDGFDAQWGARPLRRLIENTVESYLAKKILGSEINAGDEFELGLEVFGDQQVPDAAEKVNSLY